MMPVSTRKYFDQLTYYIQMSTFIFLKISVSLYNLYFSSKEFFYIIVRNIFTEVKSEKSEQMTQLQNSEKKNNFHGVVDIRRQQQNFMC